MVAVAFAWVPVAPLSLLAQETAGGEIPDGIVTDLDDQTETLKTVLIKDSTLDAVDAVDAPDDIPPAKPSPTTVDEMSERKLVSVLKRNLPESDEPLKMGDAPAWFQSMMQRIVRKNIPDKYVRDKDWGKTDKRWDGLRVERKGPLKIYTKRRWKEVNHGNWKRYEITQVDPDENLRLKIENVHDAETKGRVAFEVELASKIHAHGRRAKWQKGVQVYSLSADADAFVVMRLWCEVGMRLDIAKFPPDVVLTPTITKANLNVSDFRLRSISKLDGPVVKQLGKSLEKVLREKVQEERRKLPEKINKEIAKNTDKLRLSMADFAASKWSTLTGGKSETKDQKEGGGKAESEL